MRSLPCLLVFFVLLHNAASSQEQKKSAGLILGKWEGLEGKMKTSLEFTKTGSLVIVGDPESLAFAFKFAKILTDFKAKPEIMPLKYQLPEEGKLEVESDWSKLLEALDGGDPTKSKDPKVREVAKRKLREVVKIAVNEKELSITNDKGKSLVLTRVK
jgi:hypothetical protein